MLMMFSLAKRNTRSSARVTLARLSRFNSIDRRVLQEKRSQHDIQWLVGCITFLTYLSLLSLPPPPIGSSERFQIRAQC